MTVRSKWIAFRRGFLEGACGKAARHPSATRSLLWWVAFVRALVLFSIYVAAYALWPTFLGGGAAVLVGSFLVNLMDVGFTDEH